MTPVRSNVHPARAASFIVLLAGLWLFVSPWVYGAAGNPNAWNSWIVGGLMFVFGLIRMNQPRTTGLSWFNSLLGLWIIASPWIFGYAGNSGRLVNSLCVGIIVFCAAITGANSQRMSHDMHSTV